MTTWRAAAAAAVVVPPLGMSVLAVSNKLDMAMSGDTVVVRMAENTAELVPVTPGLTLADSVVAQAAAALESPPAVVLESRRAQPAPAREWDV